MTECNHITPKLNEMQKIGRMALCLVFLASTSIVQAQDPETGLYRSFFGEESSSWNGVTEYYDMIENQWMRTDGDTIFSGMVYKKIKSSTGNFLLREDLTCGKLWCRYLDEDSDFLVADLSLSLNDTVSLLNKWDYHVHQMSYRVIDTVTTEQGRIVILEASYGPRHTIKFIEGVGGTNLFDCLKCYAFTSQVMCCHRGGELVYHESYKDYPEENCKIVIVGLDEIKEKALINIWPNPCKHWFMIKGNHIQVAELYDVMGHRIIENIIPYKKIDTSKLPCGVYLLRVKHNGSIITRKIIKK